MTFYPRPKTIMIRVTVFDDSKAMIRSLKLVLKNHPELYLAGAFPDATDSLRKVAQTEPDVVLMDIQMPQVSGIEAVAEIKQAFPSVSILMQTIFDDDDKVFAALCAGASGYLLKGTPLEKVLEAVKEVHSGGAPMSPAIARKVLATFQEKNKENAKHDYEDLTTREREILGYLAKGLSYKMIADTCHIAMGTVNTHLKKIYEKLHVNSATEAVAKARDRRIV